MNVLKIYNDTYFSLLNVNDVIYRKYEYKSHLKNFDKEEVSEEEKIRISTSRTKRKIKEICLCNDFQYFVTMTVSSKIEQYNRFDLEDCIINCRKFMRKLRRKSRLQNIDFKYLFIFEKHKNGAYHFHGLMKGLPADDIYENKNGYLSSKSLDKLGYNSFSNIEDYNKCSNYMTKYITKELIRSYSHRFYYCSQGLKRPTEEIMIEEDLFNIFGVKPKIDKETGEIVGEENDFYSSEYCQKRDFDISKLTEKQKLKLNAYFAKNDEYFQNDNNYITNWLKIFTNIDNIYKIKIHK